MLPHTSSSLFIATGHCATVTVPARRSTSPRKARSARRVARLSVDGVGGIQSHFGKPSTLCHQSNYNPSLPGVLENSIAKRTDLRRQDRALADHRVAGIDEQLLPLHPDIAGAIHKLMSARNAVQLDVLVFQRFGMPSNRM